MVSALHGFCNYGFGFHRGGTIMMMLLWLVIIFFAVWLFKKYVIDDDSGKTGVIKKESPEEIARQRFARGEINREELQEILKELEK